MYLIGKLYLDVTCNEKTNKNQYNNFITTAVLADWFWSWTWISQCPGCSLVITDVGIGEGSIRMFG